MSIEGIEARIADALLWHLGEMSPGLPTGWPDREFTPRGRDHLRVKIFPSGTEQVTFGESGYYRHAGLIQISLFTNEGGGEIAALEVASRIEAHFRRGTVFARNGVTVRIPAPPTVGGSRAGSRSR
jgi:hypothetical protein